MLSQGKVDTQACSRLRHGTGEDVAVASTPILG